MQKTLAAGMEVTSTEMGDLFLSKDASLLSPIVQSRLADQKTRQVNTDQVKEMIAMYKNTSALIKRADGNVKQQEQLLDQQRDWLALEKSVKTRALQDKYFVALEKGIYTPTWMAEMENNLQETGYNFDYVRIPYTNIKNEVSVSDKEMKDYIAANARQFKREATANIEYVVFDVAPTKEDSLLYYTSMEERAVELRAAKTGVEDSSVVLQYTKDFSSTFYTETEMTTLADVPASMVERPKSKDLQPCSILQLNISQYKYILIEIRLAYLKVLAHGISI